jgi:hypothetical protein
MIGTLLKRLRVPCATADSKEAADKIERMQELLERALRMWIHTESDLAADIHAELKK